MHSQAASQSHLPAVQSPFNEQSRSLWHAAAAPVAHSTALSRIMLTSAAAGELT
eukprot:COSAG04_NODE_27_length_37012_cov_29.502127_28_plen_54_part_00